MNPKIAKQQTCLTGDQGSPPMPGLSPLTTAFGVSTGTTLETGVSAVIFYSGIAGVSTEIFFGAAGVLGATFVFFDATWVLGAAAIYFGSAGEFGNASTSFKA